MLTYVYTVSAFYRKYMACDFMLVPVNQIYRSCVGELNRSKTGD